MPGNINYCRWTQKIQKGSPKDGGKRKRRSSKKSKGECNVRSRRGIQEIQEKPFQESFQEKLLRKEALAEDHVSKLHLKLNRQ